MLFYLFNKICNYYILLNIKLIKDCVFNSCSNNKDSNSNNEDIYLLRTMHT